MNTNISINIKCPACKKDFYIPYTSGLWGSQIDCPHCEASLQASGSHESVILDPSEG